MKLEDQIEKDLKLTPKDKPKKPEDEKLSSVKHKVYPIILEGKTYNLRFDLNARCYLEERFGLLSQAFLPEKVGAVKTRAILYAGMRLYHPEITEEEIGAMVDGSNEDEIADQMLTAFADSLPKEDGKKKVKNVKAGGK